MLSLLVLDEGSSSQGDKVGSVGDIEPTLCLQAVSNITARSKPGITAETRKSLDFRGIGAFQDGITDIHD
ncbi:MAG: hypothetical protein JWN11_696 [Hyphomicrobiales bacterium]|nr:hypothetical protein [Hyphomicrobiales bacterium]